MAHLKLLPSVGPRGAERMALWLMTTGQAVVTPLAQALQDTQNHVQSCTLCGFFCEGEFCTACLDENRTHHQLCIVERASDILPIEHCGAFHGVYHTLGGRLSPLNDIGPEDLRIEQLLKRVKNYTGTTSLEIILALSSDVEGDATCHYLTSLLLPYGCQISRLAQGLPAGAGLGFADALTLTRALEGRREIHA